ncbi:MAG: hypothetical protein IKS29_07215 [Oscillospiraceae bacterium]|nr:hypothetical protein [Oscillospiraceae bacterium]
MLEYEGVQYKGFRNLYNEAGEAIGFQVGIRMIAYRGAWLSQFRFAYIEVDGEKFRADRCTFVVSGVEYTYEETFTLGRVKWPLKEAMIVRVKKPGGLAQGNHTVSALYSQVASYVPFGSGEIDETRAAHGHSEAMGYTREMIIV